MSEYETDEELKPETGESIKLIRNSKGWNFEIKLRDSKDIEQQLDRLDRIAVRMGIKYPNVSGKTEKAMEG